MRMIRLEIGTWQTLRVKQLRVADNHFKTSTGTVKSISENRCTKNLVGRSSTDSPFLYLR